MREGLSLTEQAFHRVQPGRKKVRTEGPRSFEPRYQLCPPRDINNRHGTGKTEKDRRMRSQSQQGILDQA